jgi:hypothetical protein
MGNDNHRTLFLSFFIFEFTGYFIFVLLPACDKMEDQIILFKKSQAVLII